YNPDYDSRKIVGDNYNDSRERYYGNNNVEGPDAFHGTFVAGIIAADHQNGIGARGVARSNVSIMAVRAVPDGDERDKDVANAIKYAVDNGASVINMSFGKSYSWDKQVVDEAVKYAIKKDVLIVHASGNDNKDNDSTDNFPNDEFEKRGLFGKKNAKNFLEVGALNYETDDNMIASFSNYGDNEVDVFAPGVAIYSTSEHNSYKSSQGTSFAAPVVAGLAAIIRSHYPSLSAQQVKDILIDSSIPKSIKVRIPGQSEEKAYLKDISVSGGIINAYTAVKMASETKGKYPKRKVKKAIARP
ncbi:MAG: S8 family serine peptidase, partial [Bacteroidia bacterium]|nr:S8 family serine peptidase [Bacteroidia bacterium]